VLPVARSSGDRVAAGAVEWFAVGRASVDGVREATKGDGDTRIGTAGSVSRAPAIAKAPTMSPADSAAPAAPQPIAVMFRRSMIRPYRTPD
jgi:hypothetical protein